MRLALIALSLAACTSATAEAPSTQPAVVKPAGSAAPAGAAAPDLEARVAAGTLKAAVFAGGCFWCMEGPFERAPGVLSVVSGYAGGSEPNPTYEQVAGGRTGHAEVVRVVYDPARTTFAALLEVYWHNVDPTQRDGQFCDEGRQYRTAVFFSDDAERAAATASKAALEAAGTLPGPIVTEIVPATPFYAAEGYHQDFYRTNPTRYAMYRAGCGRDRRLQALWGASAGH